MQTRAGVWIDHRQAILVALSDSGENVTYVHSDAEKQPRRASDHTTGNFEALQVDSDSRQQRKFSAELSNFYDRVLSQLGKTQSLLIFGPGEAKQELRKQLDAASHVPQHVSVETADSMTEPQIVARVREFFQPA